MKTFFSHGKLLLTGEYLILDGAMGLSIPTLLGQEMKVESNHSNHFSWTALLHNGNKWFDVVFDLNKLEIIQTSDEEKAILLQTILRYIKHHKPDHFQEGKTITTQLQFNSQWGLGSSSTLIGNLTKWCGVDGFELLQKSFGGSGYDLAMALEGCAITYQVKDSKPNWERVHFNPKFKDQLFFVYLNQKKNSREAIANYRQHSISAAHIDEVNRFTETILNTDSIYEFSNAIKSHELMLSKILKVTRIKDALFSDYPLEMKSLGGWGGDFVLAIGNNETPNYFKSKGFETVLPYQQLIKSDE